MEHHHHHHATNTVTEATIDQQTTMSSVMGDDCCHHDHSGGAAAATMGHQHAGGMMMMYFHTQIGNDYVLFEKWKPETTGDMVWTCIIIGIVALLYEGLKYYREYLWKSNRITTYYVASSQEQPNQQRKSRISRIISVSHVLQTFLHMIQFFISYVLMLIFMTFNVWFCISVLIGTGIGFFLFGWSKTTAVDITEHCH